MRRILVAIPCYNCSAQIGRVVRGFDDELMVRLEQVIIIDNQSKDVTLQSALDAVREIDSGKFSVLRNNSNYGLGGSHKVAFEYAILNNFEYVVILHGDNQAKTEEIHNFIDAIEQNDNLGAVLGSRFMNGSSLDGYSRIRIVGNVFLNTIFSMVTLRKTLDLGSGLNIFRMRDLNDRRYLEFADNLTFNIDLLLFFYQKRTEIKFIPITWSEIDQVSNAKSLRIGMSAIEKLFWWRFGKCSSNKVAREYLSTKII